MQVPPHMAQCLVLEYHEYLPTRNDPMMYPAPIPERYIVDMPVECPSSSTPPVIGYICHIARPREATVQIV